MILGFAAALSAAHLASLVQRNHAQGFEQVASVVATLAALDAWIAREVKRQYEPDFDAAALHARIVADGSVIDQLNPYLPSDAALNLGVDYTGGSVRLRLVVARKRAVALELYFCELPQPPEPPAPSVAARQSPQPAAQDGADDSTAIINPRTAALCALARATLDRQLRAQVKALWRPQSPWSVHGAADSVLHAVVAAVQDALGVDDGAFADAHFADGVAHGLIVEQIHATAAADPESCAIDSDLIEVFNEYVTAELDSQRQHSQMLADDERDPSFR